MRAEPGMPGHRCAGEHLLPRLDICQCRELPAVFVVARQMQQQLGDGGDAEPGQGACATRADAVERRYRYVEIDHRPLTNVSKRASRPGA